jgi:hypothetical protein
MTPKVVGRLCQAPWRFTETRYNIRVSSLIRHSSFEFRHLLHPFTFPIGVNRATGLLIPANSVAAITSSMSL